MPSQRIAEALRLWSDYVSAKRALLQNGYVRSFKSTEADLAEWLVAQHFQGELPQSKSHPSYDIVAGHMRIQVKSLCKSAGNTNGYIIDKKKDRFAHGRTHYAFVFFDDLVPIAVYVVAEAFVREWKKTQIKRSDLEKSAGVVRILASEFGETLIPA